MEVHAANGYLLDQFIQDVTNKRTDEYGGSIEKRARFTLEVLEAVTKVVGQSRASIRISPWGGYNGTHYHRNCDKHCNSRTYSGMRMPDPRPGFGYLVSQIAARFPGLAYLHVVEPRTEAGFDRVVQEGEVRFVECGYCQVLLMNLLLGQ